MNLRLAGLCLAILVCEPAAAFAGPPDTAGVDFTQRPGAALPLDAPFLDQDGRSVTPGQLLDGKPAVLVLGYFHCPSLCGTVREDAVAALAQTGLMAPEDYSVLDISIDPHEGPADASAARRQDAGEADMAGWHYLTGPAEAAVAQAVGFHSRWDKDLQQFLHPTGLVVLTPGGAVSAYAFGAGYRPAALRAALIQARAGVVAPETDVIRLLCFHFDASTGRYTLDVMKALRIGGAAIVLLIGGLVLALRRRGGRAATGPGTA